MLNFNFPKIPGKHGDGWDVVHKEWMPSSRQLLVAEFSGKSPDYLSSVNSAIAIARKGLREFRDSMRKALKERGRAQGGAGPVRGTDSVLLATERHWSDWSDTDQIGQGRAMADAGAYLAAFRRCQ